MDSQPLMSGAEIQQRRKALGYSIEYLAKELYVQPEYLKKLERGEKIVGKAKNQKLWRLLGEAKKPLPKKFTHKTIGLCGAVISVLENTQEPWVEVLIRHPDQGVDSLAALITVELDATRPLRKSFGIFYHVFSEVIKYSAVLQYQCDKGVKFVDNNFYKLSWFDVEIAVGSKLRLAHVVRKIEDTGETEYAELFLRQEPSGAIALFMKIAIAQSSNASIKGKRYYQDCIRLFNIQISDGDFRIDEIYQS